MADEQRCKRSDGKRWRCRLPVMEGKLYCEPHYEQGLRRQRKQPVPDHLKLERARRTQTLPQSDKRIKHEDPIPSPPIQIGAPTRPIRTHNNQPHPSAAIKERFVSDLEQDVIRCDPEMEVTVSNREMKFDFEKSQQLNMIRKLLPVLTKMNQEKIIELDFEAKNKGICHDGLQVQIAGYTQKKECSFCKACIADVHRSCDYCSFILCLACCHDLHNGYLPSNFKNLKETRIIRSKSSKSTSWRFLLDGRICCPPKDIGGCDSGLLHLTSFYPFSLTKDLEESAKKILSTFQLKNLNELSDSLSCLLCDKIGEAGLYFSIKPEFKNNNLQHFIKHWGKGLPIVIRDVLKSQPDLNWDIGFMLCEYLKKSAEATKSEKSTRDGFEIEFTRKQKFCGGITHENVWNESLKFKLGFSSDFLQDHFPGHYVAVIQSLPVQEYTNPFTGFMNLGAYSPYQTKNPNLGSYVCISYGGLDNPMDAHLLTNLHLHAYDLVNVLVHATTHTISERTLNEVKMLMGKYNSQEHGVVLVCDESESESESESDDEDFSPVANRCGAHWDIFRREDVPKLLEYLRKYSNKLRRPHASPTKVVHPLFDDVFYLEDNHKTRLKEEFNVEALTFEQKIGEAVIIPAGCPYQMKKTKSCVNVVYEFMSPESALESIKVSDAIRLLPGNHKAKRNTVQVKKMVIDRMQGAIEEMREVFVSQTE